MVRSNHKGLRDLQTNKENSLTSPRMVKWDSRSRFYLVDIEGFEADDSDDEIRIISKLTLL